MTLTLSIAAGTFTTPIYEEREGAKNWVALIKPGGRSHAPGGLVREFLDEVKAATFEVDGIRIGEAIEFGADCVQDGPKGGKRSKRVINRRYGVVREISRTHLLIEEHETAEAALMQSDRVKARAMGGGELLADLEARWSGLQDRRDTLQMEVSAIAAKMHEIEIEISVAHLLGEMTPLEMMQDFDH